MLGWIALLISLVALPAAASPPPAAPEWLKFSHRFHLNQAGATCVDCHQGAPDSAQAADSLLPREEACLSCHDGNRARRECSLCHEGEPRSAGPLQPTPRNLKFNHRFHLQMGNLAPLLRAAVESGTYLGDGAALVSRLGEGNECMACHRGLDETDFSSRANIPAMADCLVCHTQIDPPFSCEKCHLRIPELKPATHTPDYIDLHSSRRLQLDKPSCRICHGAEFRCMGCH